jgi:ATP-dependent exoDNAse (exonuclease V) beta subunit
MDLLSREAVDLVRCFLEKPIAKEVFTKPQSQTDLWRERAFDVMLDGQWVSGVFDRVAVHRSKNGVPDSAIIYDFKTDHGSPAEIEERYAGQMEVYRKAVCSLLQLSPDCVKAQILCIR